MAKNFDRIDQSLPFFAYGLFKQDELAFHQIEKYVERMEDIDLSNAVLYDKDGVALMKYSPKYKESAVKGTLIEFKNPRDAYSEIDRLEPDEMYMWRFVKHNGRSLNCVVCGLDRDDSIDDIEPSVVNQADVKMCLYNWSSKNDISFTHGMGFLYDQLDKCYSGDFSESDEDKLFRLQMYYSLLYSILNRYSNYVYGRSKNTISEKCFKDLYDFQKKWFKTYNENINNKMKTLDLKSRGERVTEYDGGKNEYVFPEINSGFGDFGEYFRVIRNNTVHRGKGMRKDLGLIKAAFLDLFFILYFRLKEEHNISSYRIDEEKLIDIYSKS